MYNPAIAIGHFARALAAQTKGPSGQYQAVAVLALMWHYADDPFADTGHAVVSADVFSGIVPTAARFRQIITSLKRIGALSRVDGGRYALFKPDVDKLDAVAQREVREAVRLVGGRLPERRKKSVAEIEAQAVEAQTRAEEKKESYARRREALAKLGKQPSDVRDPLAVLAGKKPTHMRYSGAGSGPVQAAIDWLACTGATWVTFLRVCKAAHLDRSDDRPREIEWLFAPRNSDYLNRILSQVTA